MVDRLAVAGWQILRLNAQVKNPLANFFGGGVARGPVS